MVKKLKKKLSLLKALLKLYQQLFAMRKKKYVVVHHGAGSMDFRNVNGYHKKKWGFESSLGYYIGYHKWISYYGGLKIARHDNEEGAHCVEPGNPGWWNKNSVGICLQGNFEMEKPRIEQLATLKRELKKYKAKGYEIKMHNQIAPTLCPGRYLIAWLLG